MRAVFRCLTALRKVSRCVHGVQNAFEVGQFIVERVAVDVMDMMLARNRTVGVFPNMPMQEPSPRPSRVEIAAVLSMRTVWIPPITMPVVDKKFAFHTI
jgi:hypothetical protein